MCLRILISGACGHMGRAVWSLSSGDKDIRVVAGYDVKHPQYPDFPVFNDLEGSLPDADVIIDFSHPSAFDNICGYAKKTGTPIVCATTGLSQEQLDSMSALACFIPVFYSPNMSMGVNLLINAVKKLAADTYGIFDIEIIEKHHRSKVDSPSGTALKIAEAINQSLPEKYDLVFDRETRRTARPDNEIGISSVRAGTIAGEHTVIFAGRDEVIEIKHTALSRDIFASGALNAAKFIADRLPGLYSMNDLFGGK
jgi:4-hydroxy-tetrahydrodipicolinate reductase